MPARWAERGRDKLTRNEHGESLQLICDGWRVVKPGGSFDCQEELQRNENSMIACAAICPLVVTTDLCMISLIEFMCLAI